MTIPTIFTVAPEHLVRLTPKEAVVFIADLLYSEATKIGLPVTSISITRRFEVPDGGVDAQVDAKELHGDFIRQGKTAYQLKTGTFEAWQDYQVRKELFGKNKDSPSREALGEPVRTVLDADGTYVLVCLGMDFTPGQRQQATDLLTAYFRQCGYATPRVDVVGQSQIIALLRPFPSICLALNGHGAARFQTLGSWADDDQMRRDFKEGPDQHAAIEAVQRELRQHSEAVHVRILGEAGVGKTRLALAALDVPDLAPLVVYCDNPNTPFDDGLINDIVADDNPFFAVLVVDECDADAKATLWNKLKNKGPRIKLVTIYNEFESKSGNTVLVEVPPLRDEQVIAILKEYLPPSEPADRWVPFCGGSPRLAHLLGANLKNNPDDPLRPGDTVNAWNRIIAGPERFGSGDVQERLLTLQYIALFKRVGISEPYLEEAKFVAAMIEKANRNITWPRFQAIVKTLRDRKLLQGESVLYVAAPLLHIKLWTDWWDTYSGDFEVDGFEASLPGQLRDWFHEMFSYARESSVALAVVKRILSQNAALQRSDFFEEGRSARFFLALTDAAPDAALEYLQRTVGTWDSEHLRTFEGRREAVWALERIAVWRYLFAGAARVLLRLAETETEHFSNNATGVFAGLFSPGPGRVAPTEASPEERFPVLVEALTSKSDAQRAVALKAADTALETMHFSRMVGAEYQGLKRHPELWAPRSHDEMLDAYRRVWQLLYERMDHLSDDDRKEAIRILLGNARGLGNSEELTPMVVETLTAFLQKPYVNRKDVIGTVEDIYRYDAAAFGSKMRAHWDRLRAVISPSDFHSRMERYVGMDRWADTFDEHGKHGNKVDQLIAALAHEAVADRVALARELPWLVTDQAKNGFRFGYELGVLDGPLDFLELILREYRAVATGERTSAFFLGGYFKALSERDQEACERQLDQLTDDDSLRRFVPELTFRSRLTDRGGHRILTLAQAGRVEVSSFRMFVFGGVIRGLSEPVFHEWIECLLGMNTPLSVGIGVDLCHFYYLMADPPRPLPKEPTLALLTADPFFRPSEAERRLSNDYDWNEVAEAFVVQHPDASVPLAKELLGHFGEKDTIVGGFRPQSLKALEIVFRRHALELWPDVAAFLGPPIDSRAFHLKGWLRDGALTAVPPQLFWDWIAANVEERASYAASLVPPTFPGDVQSISARELLIRYGSRKDVRQNLIGNFYSESWSGPASQHYAGKLKPIEDAQKVETNPNVLQWLAEYADSLRGQVRQARQEEERRGF
jgi:hypothetical protein